MATTTSLINLGSCTVASAKGTNHRLGCTKQLRSARALWGFRRGYGFASGDTFDLAAVQALQAAGNLIVLNGVNTFEEVGDDDNYETLDDTTRILTNEGKYAFQSTFTNGLYFNAALHTIKGFGNYDWAIVTSDKNIFGTTNSAGAFTGFECGVTQPAKLQTGTTTTGQKEGLFFQMLDRDELDSDYALIQYANLDFNPLQDVSGVNDVTLSFTTTPADSDTSVSIKAVLSKDGLTPVSGLLYTQFLITNDGSTTNPSGGDDSTTSGTYVLTGITAIGTGDVIVARIYDNSGNKSIVISAGELYKSNTLTATATA